MNVVSPPPAPSRTGLRPDLIRRLARRWIPLGLLILAWLCLLVRLTVRDAYVWSAALFYMGPWPLLFAAWPVLAVWLRAGRFIAAVAALGLMLTFTAWKLAPPVPPLPTMEADAVSKRILFWNIGHLKALPTQLDQLIARHEPDLFVLAEAEKLNEASRADWRQRFPAYQTIALRGGLLAFVKGQVRVEESIQLPNRSNAHRLRVEFAGGSGVWHLIVADLGPWPLTPRLERTERIRQLAGREPRTLVVGDFNTPYDSVAFDSWRYQWFHGLSQSARTPGAATWPIGLPLLSIDHVWLSKGSVATAGLEGNRFGIRSRMANY